MISVLGGLEVGAYPSDQVLCGCYDGDAGKIAHVETTEAKPRSRETRPYTGCHHSAHNQTNILTQNTVAEPTMLDCVGLGLHEDNEGTYISTVSDESSAPEAYAELAKCAVRYSCKAHIMTRIELCNCEATE